MIQHPPHIAKAMNALDHSFGSWVKALFANLGAWRRRNHRPNMTPSSVAAQRAIHAVAMLTPAAMNAIPVK